MNVIVLFVFEVVIFKTAFSSSSCFTPNGDEAFCVPLYDCPVILKQLGNLDNITKHFYDNSKCENSMICCGERANYTELPATFVKLTADKHIPEILENFWNISDCGMQAENLSKIRGGQETDPQEFPWVAALEYVDSYTNENAGIRCGGSVINNRYVLTAAHCVPNHHFKIIRAWLGVWNISSVENCENGKNSTIYCPRYINKIDIEHIIAHEDYDEIGAHNDIALLRLNKEIEFNNYTSPICLPSPDLPSPGSRSLVTIAGWGLTENGTSSPVKLKAKLAVRPNSVCEEVFHNKKITSRQLCAGGERNIDACKGDSGGPLMKYFENNSKDRQWFQQGIVSYGWDCDDAVRPSVYTWVPKYITWIRDNTLRGSPCTTPNGRIGACGPLDTCQVVFNLMSSRNNSDREFASRSRCGYDIEDFVCCESPGSVILAASGTLPDREVCGMVIEEPKIKGGQVTDPGEFPWVVGLEYKNRSDDSNAGIRCSGSLINNRYIVTAAQCLLHVDFEPISVWLGAWNLSRNFDCTELIGNKECGDAVKKLKIKEIIPHPFYNATLTYNDIGLIRLENDVEVTDYIKPICLPTTNLPAPEVGTRMSVAGWRTTENGTISDIKLKARVLIVPNETCQHILQFKVRPQQLCARGYGGTDSCGGGSTGQPLMRIYQDKSKDQMQWYQDGIVSYGIGCGIEMYPAIYTRVSSYMKWITKVIAEE